MFNLLNLCMSMIVSSATLAAQPPPQADWQKEVVYQVYPRSFADADGDGMGDLRGILSKVDYLQSLGVNVVWLNPIYKSTHFDNGYDVSGYLDIDPAYGTMADWIALRDALHARGMKIMMDLVLNHSSDEHPWFIQEKHVKALHHTLAGLLQSASDAQAERILNLLADPESVTDAKATPKVAAAAKAITAFMAMDSGAAEAAGYPPKAVQLSTLARALAPCVRGECPEVGMPFDDFYIWRDHPNNWTSLFSGSAWHKVAGTGAYYMSLFSVHQVDLNWRNPRVRQAMAHVISTWEARGVDGLRLDSLGTLSKNPSFADAPPSDRHVAGTGVKSFTNLPEVHRYLRELSRVYTPQLRSIGEVAFSHSERALVYAGIDRSEVKEVFVFDHLSVDCRGPKWRAKPMDVAAFKKEISYQQSIIHDRAWLGNYIENHDQLRVVSRFGNDTNYRKQSGKLFGTLLMTLEGTPYLYQGQEIGMTNLKESTFSKLSDIGDIEARNYYKAQVKAGEDPKTVFHQVASRNRDHVRSAMQWSDAPFAGFSAKQSVNYVNDNYRSINVAESIADPDSILNHYKKLIALRRKYNSWVHGKFIDELPNHPKVFAYSRSTPQEKSVVLLNISDMAQDIILPKTAILEGTAVDLVSNYPNPDPLTETVHLRPWESRVYVGRPQPDEFCMHDNRSCATGTVSPGQIAQSDTAAPL